MMCNDSGAADEYEHDIDLPTCNWLDVVAAPKRPRSATGVRSVTMIPLMSWVCASMRRAVVRESLKLNPLPAVCLPGLWCGRENVFEVMARKQAEAASPSEASEPTTSRKQQKVSTRLYCVSHPGPLVSLSHMSAPSPRNAMFPILCDPLYCPPLTVWVFFPPFLRSSLSLLTGAARAVQRAGRAVSRQAEGRVTPHRHHRRPPQHGRLYIS